MADDAEMNGLTGAEPGGALAGAPAGALLAPSSPPDPLSASEVLFDDLSHRKGLLDKILQGLTSLSDKADMVDQEDVTEVAGKLVAAGLKPNAMASLLANMPTQPEMLAKWIGGLRQMAEQRDVELTQQLKLARHNMMTHALGTIIKTPGMNQPFGTAPAAAVAPEPGNSLSLSGAPNASS